MRTLTRFFGILPGETRTTVLLFFNFLMLISGFVMARSVRDGLFLSQSTPLNLPYLYVAIALLMMLAIPLYSRITQKFQAGKAIAGVQIFVSLTMLFFWHLFSSNPGSFTLASFYIWVSIYGAIGVSQFWLIAGQLNDARAAKRLFGFIGSGGILGGILGGFGARWIAGSWGTEQILPVIASLSLICAVLAKAVSAPKEEPPAERSLPSTDRELKISGAIRALKGSRYLLWIFIVLFLTELISTFVDFQFKVISRNAFPEKDELTAFLGSFYGFLNLANFVFQILLTARLIQWAGVKGAILVLPFTILTGSFALIYFPALWTAIWLKIGDDGLRHSIHRSILELLYQPVPNAIRENVKVFLDSYAVQLATGLGGLLLLGYTRLYASETAALGLVVFLLSILWIAFSIITNSHYVNAFREGLKKRAIDPESTNLRIGDVATLETLIQALNSSDEKVVLYAIEFLQRGKKSYLVSPWLLHHPSSRVRLKVVELISNHQDRSAISLLKGAILDENVEVQAEALQTICLLEPEAHEEMVVSLSGESDPQLRRAAILCAALGSEEQQQQAHAWLGEMIHASGQESSVLQTEAAKALAKLPAKYHDLFPDLFISSDREVVKQAIRSAAMTANLELIPFLVERLGDRKLKAEARAALLAYGVEIIPVLEQYLTDESVPLWARRHIPKTIGAFGTQSAADALFNHFDHPDPFIRDKVLIALNQLRTLHPELRFERQKVEQRLTEEAADYFDKLAFKQGIFDKKGPDPRQDFLARSLDRRRDQSVERIFRFLALIHSSRDVWNVYASLKSQDPAFRSAAIEYMDNTLDRTIRRIVLPVIDSIPDEEKLNRIQAILPVRRRTAEGALVDLLNGKDSWLVACAVYWIFEQKRADLYPYITSSLESDTALVRETAQWVLGRKGLASARGD